MKKINIEGEKFGGLIAIKRYSQDKYKRFHWLCKCECGNDCVVGQNNLRSGNTVSCGCHRRKPQLKADLSGERFNRLIILKRVHVKKSLTHWLCECDCGSQVVVFSGHLKNGHTKSCGCLVKEIAISIAHKFLLFKKRENHPRWDKLKCNSERLKERPSEIKEWSRKVLRLNNFTCLVCKKKGGVLNAHHLNSYQNFPLLRFEISNGVCLCKKCHINFHRKYGWKTNKLQFEEYLSMNYII